MIRALARRYHFSQPKSKMINPLTVSNSSGAGFEDVICGYVDVLTIANKIKSPTKRAVLAYKALGYDTWEIALNLSVSERTIKNYIKDIKKILHQLSTNGVSVNNRG